MTLAHVPYQTTPDLVQGLRCKYEIHAMVRSSTGGAELSVLLTSRLQSLILRNYQVFNADEGEFLHTAFTSNLAFVISDRGVGRARCQEAACFETL
jgi:hypothetical protein